MNEKLRPLIMLAAVSFLVPMGEVAIFRHPLEPWDQYKIIDVVLAAYAIYWWYWLDRRERGFRTGTWQNMGVALVSVIGVPIYLIRSRGWAKGALASVIAFVIYLAAGALTIVGELAGRHIAF